MAHEGTKVYDYVVLGCGISALTAVKHLCEKSSTLVIEHYMEPGGNHQSYIIDGMEFDIGSIYFNTRDEQFRYFPELLRECVVRDVEVKKICPNGLVGKYPFDWRVEVSSLGIMEKLACLWSLLKCRLLLKKLDSAGSYAMSRIGEALYRRAGLDIYIKRLFGVDAEDIDLDFGLKRMQWLARETSVRYRVRRKIRTFFVKANPHGETLVRPTGGFGQYYRRALVDLRDRGVDFTFGDGPTSIDCSSPLIEVRTENCRYLARKLISTIPIEQISALCGLPAVPLPTVTLLSLFVALRGTWKVGCSVLYNFHDSGNWKRVTVHSDFYPGHVYDKHFTVEITVPVGSTVPEPETAFAEFAAHILSMNLIDGELYLIGSSQLTNAYPVPEKGFKPRRDTAIATLGSKGVTCLGRQGKFEYLPHSNVAAKEAVATLRQALSE